MNTIPSGSQSRRLSENERAQFRVDGYVSRLPLFDTDAVREIQRRFFELCDLLPTELDMSRVNCWHKANIWVYNLSRTPSLLDYIEDLAGQNFFLWGAQFFCKFPRDGTVVPWHQDAQYWPLTPRKAVTAWIAIFDTDRENAAMQVVRGTHLTGDVEHHAVEGEHYILSQAIDPASIDSNQVVSLELRAGEISLHDDGLMHGSGPNSTDRMRAGLALRFSPCDVKCDMSVWPNFESYLVRGTDEFRYNPEGKIPSGEGFPIDKFQHSSDFE